ncbi:MAG: hypothetical protein EOP50_08635 [Sphingobacteriales bacterium]|nr:MAG: hypothetical protein EOP50_08635 [Sphingobacteriales bacterium]
MPNVSKFQAVSKGLCPKCRQGKIFQTPLYAPIGFGKMNEFCPHCGMQLIQKNKLIKKAMTVCFYLQDGVEVLDFAGPMEVFSYAGAKVFTVSKTKKPITSQGILKVIPDYDITNAPAFDILAVFGGNAGNAAEDPAVIDWIKARKPTTQYYFSVCTGAFILGKAGLLDKLTVTTFHESIDKLQKAVPTAKVVRNTRFVDNGTLRTVWSTSAGLADVTLRAGDPVKRRQKLGTIANRGSGAPVELYLEIRTQWPLPAEADPVTGCEPPSDFIRSHRKLTIPAKEKSIIIASKKDYRLLYCRDGKVMEDLPIALSQKPLGPKIEDGDNRTPEGEYRIIQKAEGPFDGEYGKFLGSRWMRINYPNTHDARAALKADRIATGQCDAIIAANASGKMPPAGTKLGGGVGIHGWASDWPDGPQNLTWGCLSLREADLKKLYSLATKGTVVIISP